VRVVITITVAALLASCGGGKPSRAAAPSPFSIVARYGEGALRLNHARDLAVGPDGDLYVTDLGDHVTVLSPAGKVLRRWGGRGKAPGRFHFVSTDPTAPDEAVAAITVGPDGSVYVSDSGNYRVQVFTPAGRFVRQFGSFGGGPDQFLVPFEVVADRTGVYVLDDQRPGLVRKFSPQGRVVWKVGGESSSDHDLTGHLHVANIDAHGRLVLANDDNGRIVYLDRDGHKVDAFGDPRMFPGGACDVTVDTHGDTYVTSCDGTRATQVFDPTHRLVGSSRDVPLAISPRFGPSGVAFALGLDGSVVALRRR
jgi:DNA-binding beta-propeller fold protein YncE